MLSVRGSSCFFFSSRRRHTRCSRDWSSDVCSSDLAGLSYDTSRTSLSGDAQELQFGKVGGAHLLFQTGYQRRSAGFEINDLGYLQRADQQTWSTWMEIGRASCRERV